jgi:predicted PurR-regulated permease PerM
MGTLGALLGVLVAIMVAAGLREASGVLVPLVMAFFLSYLLTPLMDFLSRRGLPVLLTLPVVLLGLLGALALLEVLVVNTVDEIAEKAPYYGQRLEEMAKDLAERLGGRRGPLANFDWVRSLTGSLSEITVDVFGEMVNFAANLALVLTYTAFILLGRASFAPKVARAFSTSRAHEIMDVLDKVNLQIQRYVVAKILLSMATGVCMGLACWVQGVDFALFWGLLGFLLNFIPTVGSAVAAMLPIALSLVQFESPLRALGVALSLIAIQQVIGNFIEPSVQGRQLNLSPIVVLFALVFFGWLWGLWGMVLSVPLVAVLKIIFEHNRALKPFAVMLEK